MIDPYLSDHLAKKYAGKEFPHIRMMQPPLNFSEMYDLNFILSTHRHSDHMDPEAVPVLLKNNPDCKIIVPRAEKEHIFNNIVSDNDKVVFVNADDNFELASNINLEVISSAHEELKTDQEGNHHYLGYVLKLGDISVYHSGDCIPYVGLEQELKKRKIDIALLPVNGRDEQRRSKGVPGNFIFEESVELCTSADIPIMICHHFGMFEFNTVDNEVLLGKAKIAGMDNFECIIPETDMIFQFGF